MVVVCGLDEAGRGCVIGPLVVAGACFKDSDLAKLRKMGVKDSKLLSVIQRERLYKEVVKIAKSHKIVIIDNNEIDSRSTVGLNLNELEALKIANIIEELSPEKAVVDSPHPIESKFEELLFSFIKPELRDKFNIIAEHKADLNYVECAAASILAKVTRDREIDKIKEIVGFDFGSGYSSDEKTIKALEKHYEGKLSEFIRKSWVTYKAMKERKEQSSSESFG